MESTIKIDYDILGQKVAANLKQMSVDMNPNALWSIADICNYLNKKKSSVYDMVDQPGFPRSVSPGGGRRQWIAGDVMKWATGKRPRG
jgi:predicted DNA-binding transcriptional regulator AlpA